MLPVLQDFYSFQNAIVSIIRQILCMSVASKVILQLPETADTIDNDGTVLPEERVGEGCEIPIDDSQGIDCSLQLILRVAEDTLIEFFLKDTGSIGTEKPFHEGAARQGTDTGEFVSDFMLAVVDLIELHHQRCNRTVLFVIVDDIHPDGGDAVASDCTFLLQIFESLYRLILVILDCSAV